MSAICPLSGAKRTWRQRRREADALPRSITCHSANLLPSSDSSSFLIMARASLGKYRRVSRGKPSPPRLRPGAIYERQQKVSEQSRCAHEPVRNPRCVGPSTASAARRLGFEMVLDGAVELTDRGGECGV